MPYLGGASSSAKSRIRVVGSGSHSARLATEHKMCSLTLELISTKVVRVVVAHPNLFVDRGAKTPLT